MNEAQIYFIVFVGGLFIGWIVARLTISIKIITSQTFKMLNDKNEALTKQIFELKSKKS
jgi:hypothetical protein